MSQHKEVLTKVVHGLINGNEDETSVHIHDYFIAKSKEISGLGSAPADLEELENLELEGDETTHAE